MSQLKIIAVLLMYFYILWKAVASSNILVSLLITILAINYIKTKFSLKHFNKIIKNELEAQRECFINALSHDFRVPTIAQIRALELLKNEKLGSLNNNQSDMIIQIENSCKCILNLLSLMINTYSIENNKYHFIFEEFNISEIISSCFEELIPEAYEKQITFEYNNKDKDLCIIADKTELKKVIKNILSASIINSDKGGKVYVITSSCGNKIRLSFTCNKNHYISDISKYPDYTSIGHSIRMVFCKKIIENHHGKILKNTNNNLFSFELPACELK